MRGYLRAGRSDTAAYSMLGYCCVQHARILACGICLDTVARSTMPGYSCARHARIQLRAAACPGTAVCGSMLGYCCAPTPTDALRIVVARATGSIKVAHPLCRTCARGTLLEAVEGGVAGVGGRFSRPARWRSRLQLNLGAAATLIYSPSGSRSEAEPHAGRCRRQAEKLFLPRGKLITKTGTFMVRSRYFSTDVRQGL